MIYLFEKRPEILSELREIRENNDEYSINLEKLIDIFKKANNNFIEKNKDLIERDLSERCLCANLALEISLLSKNYSCLTGYYCDVEFNKNIGDSKKIIEFPLHASDENNDRGIYCDLILHDRRNSNLIALEMKKKNNKDKVYEDKERLKELTKSNGSFKYKLGIFYEIETGAKSDKIPVITYYYDGNLLK